MRIDLNLFIAIRPIMMPEVFAQFEVNHLTERLAQARTKKDNWEERAFLRQQLYAAKQNSLTILN